MQDSVNWSFPVFYQMRSDYTGNKISNKSDIPAIFFFSQVVSFNKILFFFFFNSLTCIHPLQYNFSVSLSLSLSLIHISKVKYEEKEKRHTHTHTYTHKKHTHKKRKKKKKDHGNEYNLQDY